MITINASQREKEILLMLFSAVDMGEVRPEVHQECADMLDILTHDLRE